jgi:hypothetical protein
MSGDFSFRCTKTQELPKHYSKLAEQEDCLFLDASKIVSVSDDDGVHIDAASHKKLAEAIARKIIL